jgi:hypothetical protein
VHGPTGVEEWCNLLGARFTQPPSEALQTLHNLRYTTQDARNRKSPTAYVSEIVAAAQACGQGTNEYALVLHAWTHLDIELRDNIDEPAANTTIATFMEVLRRKQVNRLDKYHRQQPPQSRQNAGQYNSGRQFSTTMNRPNYHMGRIRFVRNSRHPSKAIVIGANMGTNYMSGLKEELSQSKRKFGTLFVS